MTETWGLTELVGRHVQNERARRRLSQTALAERAGITQQWLSRIERGSAKPTVALVDRVFAALDLQLRVEIEPRDAGLDPEIDRYTAMPDAARIEEISYTEILFKRLATHDMRYVLTGRFAAFLQGAPLGFLGVELIVAKGDLPAYADWFRRQYCVRWNEHWQEFGYVDTDPRIDGAMRWLVATVDLRIEVRPEVPPAVLVRFGKRVWPVLPMAQIEATHPEVARRMARIRRRTGAEPQR
jgi:transcriptional regulator with XRE-family HTH domain